MFNSPTFGEVDSARVEQMSGPELVTLHNEMVEGDPVKRFSTRQNGITRVKRILWKLEQLSAGNGPSVAVAEEEPVAEPESSPEEQAAPVPKPVEVPNEDPESTVLYPLSADGIKPHRPNTRRGKVIRLLSRPGGASLEELKSETDWDEVDVKVSLKLIHSFLGHGIDQPTPGQYVLIGTPRDRKQFNLKPKGEIKQHRPGTKRAKTVELLSRPGGATLEEVQEVTGWNTVQSFQGVTLLHTYLGYGLSEDEEGRISLVGTVGDEDAG